MPGDFLLLRRRVGHTTSAKKRRKMRGQRKTEFSRIFDLPTSVSRVGRKGRTNEYCGISLYTCKNWIPEQNELTDSSEIEEEHERPEQGGIQQTNQREEY